MLTDGKWKAACDSVWLWFVCLACLHSDLGHLDLVWLWFVWLVCLETPVYAHRWKMKCCLWQCVIVTLATLTLFDYGLYGQCAWRLLSRLTDGKWNAAFDSVWLWFVRLACLHSGLSHFTLVGLGPATFVAALSRLIQVRLLKFLVRG